MRLWLPVLLTDRGESNTQVRHLWRKLKYIAYLFTPSAWAAKTQLLALLLIARTGRMEADTLPCSVLVFLIDICLSSCLLALMHHAVVPPVGEPQTGFTALRILLFIRSDLQLSALS